MTDETSCCVFDCHLVRTTLYLTIYFNFVFTENTNYCPNSVANCLALLLRFAILDVACVIFRLSPGNDLLDWSDGNAGKMSGRKLLFRSQAPKFVWPRCGWMMNDHLFLSIF